MRKQQPNIIIKPTQRYRIYIVDEEPVFRYGLKQLICQDPHLTVCGESDGEDRTLSKIVRLRPDLVTTGIALNQGNGLSFIKQLRKSSPNSYVMLQTELERANG